MGGPNNALRAYMKRPDRIRAVLEYYLREELPVDWECRQREGEADVPGEGLPGGGQGLGRALPAGNREPADREPDLSLASDGDGLPRNCHGQFLAMEGR